VGDVDAQAALDAAEAALGAWDGHGAAESTPPIPALEPGPIVLADRPGSVQSSVRLALPAVERTHPDHAPLQLANLVFGGYFSSRWVENIREDKGYTYSPHSMVEHSIAGSSLILAADVATEVTAAALLETWYELGRLATTPPRADELEQARQYALGSLLLGMATQAGLAGLATTYAAYGLRLDYLVEHAKRLAEATREDVAAAGAAYLAPARAATVILGDASLVAGPLARLSTVEHVATTVPGESSGA
jgi:predicted Zn-dependent peptidase